MNNNTEKLHNNNERAVWHDQALASSANWQISGIRQLAQ
jgi:hypothetical protein